MDLQGVIDTLQYCLEVFEETCKCGSCQQCRHQHNIVDAIKCVEDARRCLVADRRLRRKK